MKSLLDRCESHGIRYRASCDTCKVAIRHTDHRMRGLIRGVRGVLNELVTIADDLSAAQDEREVAEVAQRLRRLAQ